MSATSISGQSTAPINPSEFTRYFEGVCSRYPHWRNELTYELHAYAQALASCTALSIKMERHSSNLRQILSRIEVAEKLLSDANKDIGCKKGGRR